MCSQTPAPLRQHFKPQYPYNRPKWIYLHYKSFVSIEIRMHQSSSLYIEALWPNQETPTWTRWRRRRGKWWQWWATWRQGWQGLEDNCERPPNFKKVYISSQLSLSILFHLDFSLLCSSTWFERSDICLLLSSSQSEDMPQPIPISREISENILIQKRYIDIYQNTSRRDQMITLWIS